MENWHTMLSNKNNVNSWYIKQWYLKEHSHIKEYSLDKFLFFPSASMPIILNNWYLKIYYEISVVWDENLLWDISTLRYQDCLADH